VAHLVSNQEVAESLRFLRGDQKSYSATPAQMKFGRHATGLYMYANVNNAFHQLTTLRYCLKLAHANKKEEAKEEKRYRSQAQERSTIRPSLSEYDPMVQVT
jgi:hypothetical protein